ncbi:hypothetical protein ARSEF1564_003013 [Beauveria bassiana]
MGIANTGQRNRAASITSVSNDVLPLILSEEQDQQSSEKTWDFGGVDSVFFDASLEEQDDITDQCLANSPPPSTDVHAHRAVNKPEAAAKPTALVDESESSIAKGLLNGQLVSADANGNSASLGSSSPSPLHQFLMTLQKGDGGKAKKFFICPAKAK